MVGRFIDNEDFVKEGKIFAKRDHGTPLWWIVTAFLGAFCFILLSLEFLLAQSIVATTICIAIILLSLLAVVSYFIISDKSVITTVELQNAIFSEVAKLTSEFCIIIKYDGSIIYITPEYSRRILKDQRDNSPNISLLKKHGFVTTDELNKLTNAVEAGKKATINMNLLDDSPHTTFLLDPIGIYHKRNVQRELNLASNGVSRPSGYFLLRTPKTTLEENRATMRELSFGNYVIDKKNNIQFANRTFDRILGYEDGEIIEKGVKLKNIFCNEDELEKLLRSKKDYQTIVHLLTKDNTKTPVFISHKSIRDSNIKSFGIITPLINQSLIPKEKKGSNNFTGNNAPDLVENSPIATAILDVDGRILRSNEQFQFIVDKAGKKSRKPNVLDIITDDLKKSVRKMISDILKSDISEAKSIDIKISGDKDFTASLYINNIIDKSNHKKGLIAHLIDTTELKNLEMRFVHSQKMQAVGQLAGGIAHDFNNLLTAMMGFCDLLLMRHPAGDSSFADIMQIKQNANRAANLVRQLLAFSRKQTLQPEIINITDVLADLSNLIGRLIGENIELKMIHGRNLGNVRVDQGQLEQVIINLAVNARDAMTEGGVLTISTENIIVDEKYKVSRNMIPPAEDEIIEPGEYVLIEVTDTGCGIKKDTLGNIFEPFFSTKEVGAGTGLGLSTVYGIIKQTDGYIYVSSRVGKGSKFSIFLKRYDNNKDIYLEKKEDLTTEKHSMSDLDGNGTILLVEDETPVRIFSNSALTSKGYKVLEADCAEAALQIFEDKSDDIDIIITDVVMPGISGPDMIKIIYEKFPDIKVIFISGYGEDAFIESFGEERKFNFLSKPYTLKQLASKVKDVLDE